MSNTRVRITSESGDGAAVVSEQFTREFVSILQLTREKQAKQVTSDVASRLQVACFGDIAQKLVPIVDRLQASEQLSVLKKTELLLTFGDKFYDIEEFQAASMFFYEKVLILDELNVKTPVNSTQTVLERILTNTELPTHQRGRVEGQTYIQSLFGVAMCCFHNQKKTDGFVKYPGRLEKIIESLTFLRLGMELAVAMEHQYSGQFMWLALNGTILIYSIAKPLQTLGFSKEVVDYLKWSLLVTESSVTLATTKYILWRLQLGSVVCDCYEDLALKEPTKAERHLKSAENCAQYIQQIVQRLRKEEELDLPLPVDVQRALTQAETTSALLLSRVKKPTRSAIEIAFPSVQDQICAAIDALERDKKKTISILPSTSGVDERFDLFELVLEIVIPMLKLLEEEGTSVDSAVFPLSFHMVVIRHCLQFSKPRDEMILLLKSAQSRLSSDIILPTDVAMIKCLLELYESIYELQTSWLAGETLSEEEMPEYRERLPISGKTIPVSAILTRLSQAIQSCVFHGDGATSRSNSDLMTSIALQMYHELAIPMLKELDATEPLQFSKSFVRLTCELLLTIHFTFTAVKFDDLLLHGHISLRLATLLSVRGKARRGGQIVRQSIERINSRRDELVNISSHFHALGPATLLSKASFSCAIESSNLTNSRDVGVPGTGSQLGGLSQDLCCVQVDLLLLLYRLELQDATVIDTLPLTNSKEGVSLKNTVLSSTETKLDEECNHNGYAKVLLNTQCLTHPQKSVKERRKLADESIQLLKQMEIQEEKLRSQLQSQELKESVAPAAPVIISRSSSAITVKVVEFRPSLRKKQVQYYMVFAKSVGAGTAVSLNSNQLPGTATPLYPPHLSVTISSLLPNESYVFAVAAFDSKHEIIQSIGDTSEPVVALNPLPVLMCYGYLAKACDDCQLPIRATQTANYLYNAVISHCGRPSWMANPFYRQALKREIVAQYPIPTLNLCIQALLILTHEELGDLDREGKLVTCFDSDAQALTSIQTKALEDCRKITIAIEIACATDNQEAIRVLSFKGYRLLLPLLHLEGSCDGLTFAALVTFYQALHVIPSEYWDIDTRTICARVGFELFRIAQDTHKDIRRATVPLLTAQREQVHPEDEGLREVVALFQLLSNLPTSSPPPEAAVAAVASPRAPAKDKPQSKTPIATPRTTEETKVNHDGKLQSLNEILQSSEGDLGKIFRTLEHQSALDHRVVEYAAKVCGVLLAAGENGVARIDLFLSSFKMGGVISNYFRAIMNALGGSSLLPEKHAEEETKDNEISTSEAEADDVYLYRWCGELFFIQSVLLVRFLCERGLSTR
ncbi:Cilia- and flagella-associated protein 54 [Phytophthora citrophthora]|uniref:Cilia- and flagella-associated protein 54 n=1 Tax=Phytophthora citrophthora TaxID=4793 RepID=A0AAD9LDQ6_9STRA|nr:Cilia- and flagella-associated protein 54 [Phytophthora citrophthora]